MSSTLVNLTTEAALVQLGVALPSALITCCFWADWHEPSVAMTGAMRALAASRGGDGGAAVFALVPAEAVPELSERFSITMVPTFVFLRGGAVVGRLEGANAPELASRVDALLGGAKAPAAASAAGGGGGSGSAPAAAADGGDAALDARIRGLCTASRVVVFIKGPASAPSCAYSARAVETLTAAGVSFGSFDVLTDPPVRARAVKLFDWPTYPMVFVGGHLIGGVDAMAAMAAEGTFGPVFNPPTAPPPAAAAPPALPGKAGGAAAPPIVLTPALREKLHGVIARAPAMLFIKGTPDAPVCGFSKRMVALLREQRVPFESFDIMTDEEVRGSGGCGLVWMCACVHVWLRVPAGVCVRFPCV